MSHQKIEGKQVDHVVITRALLSVSDKGGLVEFAKELAAHNVQLLSTGGTASTLRNAGLKVTDVSQFTGSPEILHGRVKTLHPKVHGALLAVRGNADDEKDLKEHEIQSIDMVVVNLYPFEDTVKKGHDFDTCIENIDIGGPSMLRSSAKNHRFITVVCDPAQYKDVLAEMKEHKGATSYKLRQKLAAQAFTKTAVYDTAIGQWFTKHV